MSHNLKLIFKDFAIELSQAINDAFSSNKSFCSAGANWLVEHDQFGEVKQEYIEKVHQSF